MPCTLDQLNWSRPPRHPSRVGWNIFFGWPIKSWLWHLSIIIEQVNDEDDDDRGRPSVSSLEWYFILSLQRLSTSVELNFEGLKAKQAEVAVNIEKEETEILESRRALIKQTKGKEEPFCFHNQFFGIEFRQRPEEEQVLKTKDLLKLYQQEIDSLGNRLKNCHAVIRDILESMQKVPDPLPVLKLAMEQINTSDNLDALQKENVELRTTLETICKKAQALEERVGALQSQESYMRQQLEAQNMTIHELHEALSLHEKEYLVPCI